jgi:hypothetical protein
MHATDFDLAKLLRPVEPETFFRDTWEKGPLHVSRNDAGYYGGLFALADVDAVLAFSRPRFLADDFKAGDGGGHTFLQGLLPDDESAATVLYPDLAQVHAAFSRGKTISLTAMQHRWGPVAVLCRRLEEFFGSPVHTNLYLTPPGAQGFSAHFDTHEVFVLQIEGSKHWRFYGPARDLPLVDDWVPLEKERLGPPTLEAVLRPGDLLYLPRGHVHEAFTTDCTSLHLTVGVKPFRWIDLLRLVLDDVTARDVRFRQSLPPGWLGGGQASALEGPLRERLQALAEGFRAEESVERLAASFLGKMATLPGGHFAAPASAEAVGPDTVLERAPGVICRVVQGRDGRVSLRYPGGSLEGPPKIAAALRHIARTPRFAVRSLPDDVSTEGKLVLVRRLVRDRVLTIAQAPP